MYKYKLTALAAVLALSAAGFAIGQSQTPTSFDELDQDKNGLISRAEAAVVPCLSSNFDSIKKASKDGLNPNEFSAAVNAHCSGR